MRVDALFVDTPATPLDPVADLGEGELDELAHRVSLAEIGAALAGGAGDHRHILMCQRTSFP